MIKDREMSTIIENHLRHNNRNNGRRSVVPKSRHEALPQLSEADNIHVGNENPHLDGRVPINGTWIFNDGIKFWRSVTFV
ncbi:unnamed protein product [Brugia timori]|uniref:Uncharacterized protein n=1 Tax=Brugia timori TaxID=42155 RepID=A0A0R3R8C8_9BILA|nr:unnamed protein product [Brugia timori]